MCCSCCCHCLRFRFCPPCCYRHRHRNRRHHLHHFYQEMHWSADCHHLTKNMQEDLAGFLPHQQILDHSSLLALRTVIHCKLCHNVEFQNQSGSWDQTVGRLFIHVLGFIVVSRVSLVCVCVFCHLQTVNERTHCQRKLYRGFVQRALAFVLQVGSNSWLTLYISVLCIPEYFCDNLLLLLFSHVFLFLQTVSVKRSTHRKLDAKLDLTNVRTSIPGPAYTGKSAACQIEFF